MKRVLLAEAAAAAVVVLIMRHVFAKRSIFTWHSMPLALTFFLSSTIFPSCAHSYTFDGWGIFFSHFPFFSHLCYFMALRSFKHHSQFQMDCLCVRLNQLAQVEGYMWLALFEFTAFCVGVCGWYQVHNYTHTHCLYARQWHSDELRRKGGENYNLNAHKCG